MHFFAHFTLFVAAALAPVAVFAAPAEQYKGPRPTGLHGPLPSDFGFHRPHGTGVPHRPHGTGFPHGPHSSGFPHGPHSSGFPHVPRGTGFPHGPHGTGVPHGPHGTGVPHGPHGTGVPHSGHHEPHGTHDGHHGPKPTGAISGPPFGSPSAPPSWKAAW